MAACSISNYDFFAPERITFGWGRWREVGPAAAALGQRAFVVLGSRTLAAGGFAAQLKDVLAEHRVECIELATIHREPEVTDVDEVSARIRNRGVRDGDLVIAVGGGSAIDLAKAVAVLATNTSAETVRDYLEGVGRGLAITARPLPVVAMPTTAGTGSEATKNAVISSYAPPFKKSLRSQWMLPRAVVIDPQLAFTLPPAVTAQTGMDAITQLIESYISRKARAIPQALAADGLRLALGAIVEAVENGNSRPAREAMAQAALLSGMALANSGLGMAHGVAAALGVHARVPHGLAELSRLVGLAPGASAPDAVDALIERIDEIGRQIGVPRRLTELGVTQNQIPELVRDSRGNSMDGNPRSLSDQELTQILEAQL
jgi:alcohol dehydrogenase class IV